MGTIRKQDLALQKGGMKIVKILLQDMVWYPISCAEYKARTAHNKASWHDTQSVYAKEGVLKAGRIITQPFKNNSLSSTMNSVELRLVVSVATVADKSDLTAQRTHGFTF